MRIEKALPFTTEHFFVYIALAVTLVFLGKMFNSKFLPYKWVLTIISILNLVVFFDKPFYLLGLILYLYLVVLGLRKWYKGENIVFPMVVLALPLMAMKSIGLMNSEATSFITFRSIFQIAGMSYLVFKVIGLYIDERNSKESIPFLSFFNFSAFVPTLLIGPIDRHQRFQKDVKAGYDNLTSERFWRGWENIVKGLLFKFILATAVHKLVLEHLVEDGSLLYHLSYMYAYLFFLFFDFAGYSFLAVGFGNLIGIDVPMNFDRPFSATNPKEFWKKWHITLGDWLNDYFFKPIFKFLTTKKYGTSIQRQGVALFLTFTLMGFWNGFELHFVLSGMLFGLYSVLHNYYIYQTKKQKRDRVFGQLSAKWIKVISIFLMFNSVAFAIYIFSGKLF
ncbi:MAG: MBOAT family O-acyltransferase [Crocinitomicaceae bacterium]